jgi:hypothetical protein
MVYTYTYNKQINDLQQLYTFLQTNLPEVTSVTCGHTDDCDHHLEAVDITVYTDTELTEVQENDLNNLMNSYENPMYDVYVNAFRKISVVNSTNIPLYPNCVFHGCWEDVSNYSTVTVFTSTDAPSIDEGLEIHYSTDAVNSDFVKTLTVGLSGTRHQITVSSRYFKVIYRNGDTKANIRIQSIYHHYRNKAIGTNICEKIDDSFDCEVNRSIINGQLHNKTFASLNITSDGHLETAIHGPLTAFGEVSTAINTPVLQHDFIYSLNPNFFQIYQINDGVVTDSDGMAICTTASKTNNVAMIKSRRVMRYRPGQGCIGRFTGLFDTPKTGNIQFVGWGTAQTSLLFGYYGTTFGIIYRPRDVTQLHLVTITSKSDNIQNVAVVLNGITYSVPVTNGSSASATAWELSQFDYTTNTPGWDVSAVGNKIYFMSVQAGSFTGEFSISFPQSGEATIEKVYSGSSSSTQFIPQTSWNIDKMDGSGSSYNPSNSLLNPLKGNVFYIKFQYLGFGFIEYGLEDGNTTETIPVHRIKYANNNTLPSMANPTLPFTMINVNTSNTTAVALKTVCCAGFVQGEVSYLGTNISTTHTKLGITDNLTHIFTIRSCMIYHNKPNMKNIVPNEINLTNFGSNFAEVYIVRYGKLDTANFIPMNEEVCVTEIDTTATTITNGQIKYSTGIAPGWTLNIDLDEFEMNIEANTTLSVLAKTLTGTTNISCSFNYAED